MVLAVLSKDSLKDPKFVYALDCALHYKVRIMLLHDQASCYFPGENEQPETLLKGGVFKDKAVTFMKQYVDTCVDQILRKYQRFLDSKKEYDFLVLLGEPLPTNATDEDPYPKEKASPLGPRETQYITMFIRNATYLHTVVPQAFAEEEDPSEPQNTDSTNVMTRDIPDAKKEQLRKLVSNCHSIFYLPQGKRGPKMAVISRMEMFIYELAVQYNTTIHIIDQHGVYGVLLLKYAKRYGVKCDLLPLLSLHMPLRHIGIQIINKELKRGGCKSLSTNTRVFLSHKRSSAQVKYFTETLLIYKGMAGRIYEGLRDDYYCFLDSEADFDLHDLELIVKNTELFILILSEGILDSFWCLQELRSAIANKKKVLIIREYRFLLPPKDQLPADLADILHDSKTLDYMAEFFTPFLVKLKKEIGISDEIIMTCDAQIASSDSYSPGFLKQIKEGTYQENDFNMRVVPDATIKELHAADFIRYFIHFGNNPARIVDLPGFTFTVEDVKFIGEHCPYFSGTIGLSAGTTDFEILSLFDGVKFQRLSGVTIGDSFETRTAAITGEAIKTMVKNLPALTKLFVYNCRGINPEVWKCIGNSNIVSLGIQGSNYKPEPGNKYIKCLFLILFLGVNIPPKLEYIYGIKEVYDPVMKEAKPNIRMMHAHVIQEKV
jgi:hypothetical protein